MEGRPKRLFYGYKVAAASFFILAMYWGGFYSFGVFFDALLGEFGWTRAGTSGPFSLAFLLFGLLSILAGRLTDKFGPRKILTFFGAIFGLGFLLLSTVNSVWQLYLFLGLLVGLGLSGSTVPLTATIARWFYSQRGLMMGLVLSGIGLGMFIGPLLANMLISSYGWRIAYIIIGSICLLLIVSAAQFLRNPESGGRIVNEENSSNSVRLNTRVNEVSFREAVQTKQFWMLGFMFLCFGLYMQATMVHITPYAIDQGFSTATGASILALIGGISILGRITMGAIADKIGTRQSLVMIFILMASSLLWMPLTNGLYVLYLFALIFGFAYGGESPLRPLVVAELFGLKAHGMLHGAAVFGLTIGGSIGPPLLGAIFDRTGGYQSGFLICAGFGAASVVLAFLLNRNKISLQLS